MQINDDVISPDEKVCFNCQHIAWTIGVGQGLRCSHPKRLNENYSIPNRRHTCDLIKMKEVLGQSDKNGWLEN